MKKAHRLAATVFVALGLLASFAGPASADDGKGGGHPSTQSPGWCC